ncbi:DUF1566 domain-containing protein [Leptospira kmetyi]|uniref:DUF1566 domain-containing protein n=1 Tax=Leptospira kmetyi TaxID=408139 RepID=A0A2M9XPV6_9LEPT|nr:DUF1566 domain-containing protein [Leptospira kmetyi]AYV55535.1 DUF1566 domain-containing protein [Leptospira kmetyi]EQA54694.1 PF07603 family protein [Leptospira kmetyi serovar Malaysia str. Bejo-Iso9]PJZ29380.1 DUF1566 domain-containing protein [Leptospira kmetyi]PJZ41341.1 DUF1566 domain-containing protein [Leptospira kmetyi]TGK16667.1 DUF1566 domain-containing protein [Leptospira kmetyi]
MKRIRTLILLTILTGIVGGLAAIGGPYTDPNDGTINDTGNRLLWRKCGRGRGTVGMNYTNCGTVSGPAETSNWATAVAYCKGLGATLGDGRQWRLPSVKELISIVDYSQGAMPIINSVLFPNTATDRYWTSTNSFAAGNSPVVSGSGTADPKQYVASAENTMQNYRIPENTAYRSMAYIVDFRIGGVVEKPKTDTNGYVRCVSGPY